jgi:hypothetical protein
MLFRYQRFTGTDCKEESMRNNVAIALIICGTVLSLAPSASDLLQGWQMAQALSEPASATASRFFPQPLEETYRIGTWILGGTMVGLGIIFGSVRGRSISSNH